MPMKSERNNINLMEVFGIALDLTPTHEENLRVIRL